MLSKHEPLASGVVPEGLHLVQTGRSEQDHGAVLKLLCSQCPGISSSWCALEGVKTTWTLHPAFSSAGNLGLGKTNMVWGKLLDFNTQCSLSVELCRNAQCKTLCLRKERFGSSPLFLTQSWFDRGMLLGQSHPWHMDISITGRL